MDKRYLITDLKNKNRLPFPDPQPCLQRRVSEKSTLPTLSSGSLYMFVCLFVSVPALLS